MPILEAPGLRLRPFAMSDLALIAEAAGDPYIVAVTTVPAEYTAEGGRAFIEQQWSRSDTGEGRSWAITRASDDVAVGQIGLWPERATALGPRASIGYWVAPSARGHGIASRALDAVTEFAASEGVRTCELYIEPWNTASTRTALNAGYRLVGEEPRLLGTELLRTERYVRELADTMHGDQTR